MIDLNDPVAIREPAAYFARFRSQGPVHWSDAHRAWMVIDHDEVSNGFRDGERLSTDRITPLERVAIDRPAAFAKVIELLRGWMIFRDDPEHARLRNPVRNVFTPRRVDGLEGLIHSVVDDVLGGLPAPGSAGTMEVRRDFAGPLPALVIAAILGVDAEQRSQFQQWSDDLATIVFSAEPRATDPDQAISATAHFADFFGELIERERRSPSDSILGHLVAEVGDDFTLMELVGACTLMLFAGHETTTSLLSNTFGVLLEQPDLIDELRALDDLTPAVEEFMRVAGPARTMFRKALIDHERGGQSVKAGQTVGLVIAAANHDPRVFDRPEQLDLQRSANPHLGFGWGLHHCVGAHLARLEAKLALDAFLDRYQRIEPVGPVPALQGTVLGYGREPMTIRVS